MSNTDPLSFAPDSLLRGSGVGEPNGKTSYSPASAAAQIDAYGWSGLGQPATVTYAYRDAGVVPDRTSSGFSPFTSAEIAIAEKALQAWADVANIHFTRVDDGSGYSDNASILFGNFTSGPAAGFTYYPGTRAAYSQDGDVWLNASLSYIVAPSINNYGGQVIVHEIGHAIGLSHPSNYDASDAVKPTYAASASYYEDSRQYSVMSYFDEYNTGGDFGTRYAAVPLIDDIGAAQRLYGANMTTRTGDTIYGFHSNAGEDSFLATNSASELIFAVWDAGGNDTFDFSGYSQNQLIDLRAGDFSNVGGYHGNVAIAAGVTIENAIGGSGYDTIVGNGAANVLQGGAGDDSLYGESGDDTLYGEAGNDLLDGGSGTNMIDGGAGTNTLLLPGAVGNYVATAQVTGWWSIAGNGLVDVVQNIQSVVLRPLNATSVDVTFAFTDFLGRTAAFAAAPYSYAGRADFNGDGQSDILWRNANGGLSTWQSTGSPAGSQLQQGVFNAYVDTGWQIVDTGDFNGDGRSDILWRNTNGTFSIWNASGGGNFAQGSYTDGSVGNDWQIVGIGDLNGDGRADILWRQTGGAISAWQSSGPGFAQNTYYNSSVGTSWKVEGLGDFNGDGHADILWRNDNGTISTWLANTTGFNEGSYVDGNVAGSWHVAALADFNGDGKDDILWRQDGGALSIWSSNGAGFDQTTFYDNSVATSWHIAEVADLNGDGKADIVWRNDNGAVSTWESNGHGFDQSVANAWADPSWSIMSHHFPL